MSIYFAIPHPAQFIFDTFDQHLLCQWFVDWEGRTHCFIKKKLHLNYYFRCCIKSAFYPIISHILVLASPPFLLAAATKVNLQINKRCNFLIYVLTYVGWGGT